MAALESPGAAAAEEITPRGERSAAACPDQSGREGRCYQLSANTLLAMPGWEGWMLVHGTVRQAPHSPMRIAHAWLASGGLIHDLALDQIFPAGALVGRSGAAGRRPLQRARGGAADACDRALRPVGAHAMSARRLALRERCSWHSCGQPLVAIRSTRRFCLRERYSRRRGQRRCAIRRLRPPG